MSLVNAALFTLGVDVLPGRGLSLLIMMLFHSPSGESLATGLHATALSCAGAHENI